MGHIQQGGRRVADRPDGFHPDRIPSRLGIPEHDRQRLPQAARQFRQSPTASEQLLWQELRNCKLGVKFRREHPIGPLVVNFCCPSLRIIVEVDGAVHELQRERDAIRQRLLEDRGYRMLRLQATEVEEHLATAVQRITDMVAGIAPPRSSPSPILGEGAGG
jgi:very-short-patch-repair endonuclease